MSVYKHPWDDPSPCRKADEVAPEPAGGFGPSRLQRLVLIGFERGLLPTAEHKADAHKSRKKGTK